MADAVSPTKVFRFGEFEVDLQAGCLYKLGAKVGLRHQAFVALCLLLERAGEVVTREELQKRLWPGDVFVDFEIDLNTIIARLREALGDSAERPRYLETLPRRGYRFLAAVSRGGPPQGLRPGRLRLVVLPFSNAGGDPADEYVSDAVTDELITAICQTATERLAVIARTTAMHYKHSDKDVAAIGRELGVDYVVEGRVRRGRNRLAMNLQLIQVTDQTHVFARMYDSARLDISKMVSRAASDIAESIGLPAGPDAGPAGPPNRARLPRRSTRHLGAYNEYIQGRFHMGNISAEGFALAKEHLTRAIARDPGFALAYDALAETYWFLGYAGYVRPRDAFSTGIVHALRAVEIDGTLGETHALLGSFHKTLDYNWREVRREMALALRLDPMSPSVRLHHAISGLMPHGRVEDAIAEIERALEFDPMSIMIQGWLGIMLVLAHRWDRAIDQSRLLLRLFPRAFWGHFVLGVAYREKRMYDEAIAALRAGVEVSGGMPITIAWLGLTLALSGNAAEARSWLRRLHDAAARGYVPPTSFAWIHLGLGELDAAFEWLDRAVDECDQLMMPIKSYAFFDPIRGDPRFEALLRKMNLEPESPKPGRGRAR